jgi:pimeloyl-ACP methyl ester carboxylesterase
MELNHHRAGSGDPLVLIHGIGSRWQMWEPVLARLAQRHEVIAIDLPGFGASPMPPPGTPPGVDSLASLVTEFLSSLGVERPHVAGNSLGGLLALELGRRGVARSATAVSPAGFANRAETMMARSSLRLAVHTSRWLAPRADRLLGPVWARRLALNLFIAHPERVSVTEAADSLQALAGAPWFDATLPTLGAMAIAGRQAILVPVTVTWGDKDRLLGPRQARRAARLLPLARVLLLRGCGHVPTYDDPEQVAEVVLEAAAQAQA